jgi:hypothetical protein
MGGKKVYNGAVHQLFLDFKKICDSVRGKVFYCALTEFGLPIKIFRLIKVCLSETYSDICIGKHLTDTFPVQKDLWHGDGLSWLLLNFVLEYAIRKVQGTR